MFISKLQLLSHVKVFSWCLRDRIKFAYPEKRFGFCYDKFNLASAPTVSYIDPVRALYAHHFLACEQALLFGRAKRVSRERAS